MLSWEASGADGHGGSENRFLTEDNRIFTWRLERGHHCGLSLAGMGGRCSYGSS
jgi:hypothetical protein